MATITRAEWRILRKCAIEAQYGNPYTVQPWEADTASAMCERGLLAWAGKDPGVGRGPPRDAYEWTCKGSEALSAYEEWQAGRRDAEARANACDPNDR